ncbi:MAG: hypothetical protein F6K56_37525 [Moorea sp. SIO3G5]|nr:hypothetical protein [Moorena sp. SIO3G5]
MVGVASVVDVGSNWCGNPRMNDCIPTKTIYWINSCLLPLAYCLLPLAFCLLPLASCLLPFFKRVCSPIK